MPQFSFATFGVVLSLAAAHSALAQKPLADSLRLRIDSVFARFDHTDTPGCALGISMDRAVAYERGYGMADLQNGLAITPSSIFHVASISKQFAAFAVGLLAEEGRLSLDAEARSIVTELPRYEKPITIRQLIHHTSGLRDQWQLLGVAGWREDDLITEGDVLDIVSRQKGLNFAPGDEYVYSNTGYTLLAVIVKRVTGKSLRQFADERIFQPLGMTSTHFHDDHTMIVRGRTSAYRPRAGGGWAISIPVFDTYGATSLFTTPRDLLVWMANLDDPKVGSRKLIDEMETSGVLNDGTKTNYGFGLTVGTYRGLKTIGHGGADAGYRAQVQRFPDRGIAVAVACNASIAAPNVLAGRVADILLGTSLPLPAPSIDTVARTVSAETKARWVGTYRDPIAQSVIRVRQAGDTLKLGDGRVLVPTSDTTVRIAGTTGGLILRSNGSGVPSIVQVPRSTRDLVYRREAPFAPSRVAQAEYAGRYESAELDVRYTIVATDTGLVVRQRKRDDMRLVPAFADGFTGGFGATFIFTRNRAKKVDGFTITDGRSRGVRFDRVK
jgi:CubicO group peptidase (beta-lactamase class C family)